jgi:hypothetical protein
MYEQMRMYVGLCTWVFIYYLFTKVCMYVIHVLMNELMHACNKNLLVEERQPVAGSASHTAVSRHTAKTVGNNH